MAKKKKKPAGMHSALKGAHGSARERFFAEGGDLASWRGRSVRQSNPRRVENRAACRDRRAIAKAMAEG